MTDRLVAAIPESTQVLPARLEPDAIGAAQDTIIGMANSAPTVAIGLSLAGLAAAAAYGSGPVIILCGIPMLIIANAYRRLNLWSANCGASFEWVGRAINPYLGFITGWLMIAGSLFGAIAGVVVLAPSVLAIFGDSALSTWPNIAISSAVIVALLVIAVIGIRLTARTQVGMGLIEYLILIGFSVAGLVVVLGHHHGTFPITKQWLSLSGIGGRGHLASGLLIAVFMLAGWDATIYVNEEVKHRRHNPGRAAVIAVALLIVIYTFSQVGLQGVVSPANLQANSSSVLVPLSWAVAVSVSTDLLAYLPTFRHAWRKPDEEPWLPYALFGAAAALILAVADFRILAGVIYPVYLLAADGAMVAMILASPHRRDTLPSASRPRGFQLEPMMRLSVASAQWRPATGRDWRQN